jgi:hypothetical protein
VEDNTPTKPTENGVLVGGKLAVRVDSMSGESGPVPVGNVSVIHRNGVVHGYSACLGQDEHGKRIRRFFKTREDAERHVDSDGLKPVPVEELWERKTELVYRVSAENLCSRRVHSLHASLALRKFFPF